MDVPTIDGTLTINTLRNSRNVLINNGKIYKYDGATITNENNITGNYTNTDKGLILEQKAITSLLAQSEPEPEPEPVVSYTLNEDITLNLIISLKYNQMKH